MPLSAAAVGLGDRVQRSHRVQGEDLIGVRESVKRLPLCRAEHAATWLEAVHRSVVLPDVDVDPDTSPGHRVVEVVVPVGVVSSYRTRFCRGAGLSSVASQRHTVLSATNSAAAARRTSALIDAPLSRFFRGDGGGAVAERAGDFMTLSFCHRLHEQASSARSSQGRRRYPWGQAAA